MVTMRGLLVFLLTAIALPATAQSHPVERLSESPRHHEWIDVGGSTRAIRTFVVYPETVDTVPVVLVIHENRGLNDWARSLADQIAEAGYIAVAPDLLSGRAPGEGNTADFPDPNAARDALYELTDAIVMDDLASVAEWAIELPATNGTLAVAGFCWGGQRAFQFATVIDLPDVILVFYGTPPDPESYDAIEAPVYGFYGENDARVTSTVAATEAAMKEVGGTFLPVIYEGAGHGFMRSGEDPDAEPANRLAREYAWERLIEILASLPAE